MAIRFSNRKTQRFYFHDTQQNRDRSYVLIYGDEVDTSSGSNHMGAGHTPVTYRGRKGALKNYKIDGTYQADVSTDRALETYFLDVGQGDAAFVVTPDNTKILIDGGLSRSTAEFLIWKYWSCPAYVPVSQLIYAAFRSKAKGLLPPNDEWRRRGL